MSLCSSAQVCELLLRYNNIRVDAVRVRSSGKTALYLAAEKGHLAVSVLDVLPNWFQIVERLLQAGANPNIRDELDISPVEIALAVSSLAQLD